MKHRIHPVLLQSGHKIGLWDRNQMFILLREVPYYTTVLKKNYISVCNQFPLQCWLKSIAPTWLWEVNKVNLQLFWSPHCGKTRNSLLLHKFFRQNDLEQSSLVVKKKIVWRNLSTKSWIDFQVRLKFRNFHTVPLFVFCWKGTSMAATKLFWLKLSIF